MYALSSHHHARPIVLVSGLTGLIMPAMGMTRTVVTALGPGPANSASWSASLLEHAIYTAPNPALYVHTPEARLRQAIVVIRHGDRAPISDRAGGNLVVDPDTWQSRLPSAAVAAACDAAFPVDGPPEPVDADAVPFGALTLTGSRQCFELGSALRARLLRSAPHLVPQNASHLAVRATNIRRTQVSVQNLLFGLLGRAQPTEDTLGAAATPVGTQGFAVTVRPLERETMLPNPKACKALKERWDVVRAQTNREERGTDDEALLDAAKEMLGYADDDEFRLDQAREVLVCAKAYGDAVPPAMTEEMVYQLMRLNAKRWFVRFADPVVAKLGMGLLVHEIEGRLSAAAEAAPPTAIADGTAPPPGAASSQSDSAEEAEAPPRCVLYSGHDSTLVPLLAALGLTDTDEYMWPPYAGSITIELADVPAARGELACRLLYGEAPMPLPEAIAKVTARAQPAAADAEAAAPPELPAELVEAGWVPWLGADGFKAHLKRVAVSPDEWRAECAKGTGAADGARVVEDTSLQDTLTGGDKRPPASKL